MGSVTITDVARLAGVSKGLVSLVLNERPGVAAATRQRVLDAAAQLGWSPSQHARGLSMRTTFTLGLVLRRDPSVLAADPFFPGFIAGVETVLSAEGWSLLLSVAQDEAAEERAYRNLARGRVEGFFLTDLRVEDSRPQLLAELAARAVLVGPALQDVELPSVNLDDRQGVVAAVEHLVDLGHRRIAYVTGDVDMVHGRGRLDAFVQAMEHAEQPTDLVRQGDFSPASGASATADLLLEAKPPTAIVYASDPMAVAGMGVLQAQGVSVPDDISVVGFDGVELGHYLHPALTTVRTDPFHWGVAAAQVLRAWVTAPGTSPPLTDHRDLPAAELLVRGSTAAVVGNRARPLVVNQDRRR